MNSCSKSINRIFSKKVIEELLDKCAFITADGNGRGKSNAYISGTSKDVGADIFQRGLCLPSDNKMTAEQQDRVIEIIHKCFE